MKKRLIYAAVAAVLIGGYAIYATFFLEKVGVGQLCRSNAQCDGQCLGFGDLLPDYSHKEICTKECAAAADCPASTSCEEVNLISSDGKGTKQEQKHYCLPAPGM